jgi:hypothetical protein
MEKFTKDFNDGVFEMRRGGPLLKYAAIGAGLLILLVVLSSALIRVTRIEAGHVGVEINLAGQQRGASEIPVRTGWVVYSPLSTQIIEFPTYVQTVKWTKDLSEGHPINEEMGFNSKEGMEIFVDVSLSYAIEPSKAPDFYVKYRVDDMDIFTHGILRDIVRNSLNEVASTYVVEDIYGEKKAEFLGKVQTKIEQKTARAYRDCYGHHRESPGHPASGARTQRAGDDAGRSREKNRGGGRRCQVSGDARAGRSGCESYPAKFADSATARIAPDRKQSRDDRQMERPIADCAVRARQRHDPATAASAVSGRASN